MLFIFLSSAIPQLIHETLETLDMKDYILNSIYIPLK